MAGLLTPHDLKPGGAAAGGQISQRALVPLMMRLKWTLWKRSFRKNIGKIIGTSIGALYGLGGLVFLTFLLGGLAFAVGDDAHALAEILKGLGAFAVLVWLLLPLLAFGIDDTLDPRLFATLSRYPRELQPGMFAASAISLPALFTVLAVAIATVVEAIWMLASGAVPLVRGILGVIALVPMHAALIVICLLLPRAVMAQSAARASSRRGRELGGVVLLVGFIAVMYAFSLAMQSLAESDSIEAVLGYLMRAVDVLAWTPFGAPAAVPLDLATGAYAAAAVRLLITAATIVGLWLWWRRSIGLDLRSALLGDASSGSAKVSALVPRFMKPDALGASVGRSLRYWRRDSRYLGAVLILPVMLVFFVAMGLVNHDTDFVPMIGVIFVLAMSGLSLANELGFDGPAGWVIITSGLKGSTSLLARVIAMALIVVPVGVIAAIVVPLVFGQAALIPLLLMGGLGAMMSAWGVSTLMAVLLPYPAPAPGTNPMKQRGSGSANAMISSFGAMLGMWVPQLPAIVLASLGLAFGSLTLQVIAGAVALVCGAITLWLCVRGGGRILDRRYVDLFQKVRAFTN